MSNVANRRLYLDAARELATSSRPTREMVTAACDTLAAILHDLSGEEVHIVPLTTDDVLSLAGRYEMPDQAASQPHVSKGEEGNG